MGTRVPCPSCQRPERFTPLQRFSKHLVRNPVSSRIKTEGPRRARLARRPNEGPSAAAPRREEMTPKVCSRALPGRSAYF